MHRRVGDRRCSDQVTSARQHERYQPYHRRQRHDDGISHMCTMCGSIFKKARGLRDHMYMIHGQRGHSRRSAVEASRKRQEDMVTSSLPRKTRDASLQRPEDMVTSSLPRKTRDASLQRREDMVTPSPPRKTRDASLKRQEDMVTSSPPRRTRDASLQRREDMVTSSPPRKTRDASLRSVISIPTERNPPGDSTSPARTELVATLPGPVPSTRLDTPPTTFSYGETTLWCIDKLAEISPISDISTPEQMIEFPSDQGVTETRIGKIDVRRITKNLFCDAPCLTTDDQPAAQLRKLREEALDCEISTVREEEGAIVMRREKAILADGTVYQLEHIYDNTASRTAED